MNSKRVRKRNRLNRNPREPELALNFTKLKGGAKDLKSFNSLNPFNSFIFVGQAAGQRGHGDLKSINSFNPFNSSIFVARLAGPWSHGDLKPFNSFNPFNSFTFVAQARGAAGPRRP